MSRSLFGHCVNVEWHVIPDGILERDDEFFHQDFVPTGTAPTHSEATVEAPSFPTQRISLSVLKIMQRSFPSGHFFPVGHS